MHRISMAVVACAVALVVAPAAGASAPINGPNCQGFVVSGTVGGVGVKAIADSFGLTVQQAQDFVRAGCAGVTTNTPRCENGQLRAADAALARGDLDKQLFHLGALENCFLGSPAGPPLH